MCYWTFLVCDSLSKMVNSVGTRLMGRTTFPALVCVLALGLCGKYPRYFFLILSNYFLCFYKRIFNISLNELMKKKLFNRNRLGIHTYPWIKFYVFWWLYIYLFYVDISELWSSVRDSNQNAFIDSIYSVQLSALQWRLLLWYAFHNYFNVDELPFWHWQIIFLSRSVCVSLLRWSRFRNSNTLFADWNYAAQGVVTNYMSNGKDAKPLCFKV